jgi:putative photosynthetic complex assembly protein
MCRRRREDAIMSSDHLYAPFPRGVLIAAAVAVVGSIALAAMGRITGAANSDPTAPAVASRTLLFKDRPDGAVVVFDASDPARPIAIVAPETNGFLRATMRGLARQRLREDASHDIPFRLTQWQDGRLTLEDPTTGRRVEMTAFGITNEEAFARLLTAKAPS